MVHKIFCIMHKPTEHVCSQSKLFLTTCPNLNKQSADLIKLKACNFFVAWLHNCVVCIVAVCSFFFSSVNDGIFFHNNALTCCSNGETKAYTRHHPSRGQIFWHFNRQIAAALQANDFLYKIWDGFLSLERMEGYRTTHCKPVNYMLQHCVATDGAERDRIAPRKATCCTAKQSKLTETTHLLWMQQTF